MLFSGLVMVAPFADVETLTATYCVAGTIPLLEPVARLPELLQFLNSSIRDKWRSKDRIAAFVRACEDMRIRVASDLGNGKYYRINIIHAQDDYDIPWKHNDQMFALRVLKLLKSRNLIALTCSHLIISKS